jgi:hypothetical protein
VRTLVGTPDPEPRPSLIWLRPITDAVPWLRTSREVTVPLGRTTAASGGWMATNVFVTINLQGDPV